MRDLGGGDSTVVGAEDFPLSLPLDEHILTVYRSIHADGEQVDSRLTC